MFKSGNIKSLFILCLFWEQVHFSCSKDVDDVKITITTLHREQSLLLPEAIKCIVPRVPRATIMLNSMIPLLQIMKERTLEYLISRDKRNTTSGYGFVIQMITTSSTLMEGTYPIIEGYEDTYCYGTVDPDDPTDIAFGHLYNGKDNAKSILSTGGR